jgi:quinol-cytochrome oxidoreductase complex cytochrome b subunit
MNAAPTGSKPGPQQSRMVRWIDRRLPVFTLMKDLNDYPEPKNLSFLWNFGSLAGIVLVLMIVTGIVLAMHYTPHTSMAFDSVERIMRDVNHGWLLRYAHANGASMFFIVVYLHVFRGLYYGSYKAPREIVWWIGLVILLSMIVTAFLGYVLPWGQMSYWAAEVITSLASAVPVFGEGIRTWLWGGFAVDNPTLNRFYSLHYLMPFVIVGLVFVHIWALRTVGSSNPLGIDVKSPKDQIPFHPYYTVKDMFGLGVFLLVYAAVLFFAPNFLGHPDNYIPADPLKTPPHIVPEWYFLPFYAILRSIDFPIWFIDAKLLGVLAMLGSIAVLFVLPWLDSSKVRSARFRPLYKKFFWIHAAVCVILGFVGANTPDDPVFKGIGFTWKNLGLFATLYYFAHFLIIMPLLARIETPKPLPYSISEPVLKPAAAN